MIELPGWEYLKARGYNETRKEGIVVEGWPVRFMPVNNSLEHEAYLNAQELDFEGVPVRVVLPEHSVAIMLKVGRRKDLAPVEMFLDQKEVDIPVPGDVIRRHELSVRWAQFRSSYDQR